MAKIIRIAAGIVTLGALLGLATAVVAQPKKPKKPEPMQLPPKSCTWLGSGKEFGQVFASGTSTPKQGDGTTWKCRNGSWSQTGGPRATRPN